MAPGPDARVRAVAFRRLASAPPHLARAVVACFCAATFGVGAFDLAAPVPPRRPVGWFAERRAEAERAARLVDGSAARLFETDLGDSSRVRATLRTPYSALLLAAVDAAPADFVTAKNGMHLRRSRVARGLPALDPDAVAAKLAAVASKFVARGAKTVVVVVPERDLVFAEQAPRAVRPRSDAYAALLAGLRTRGLAAPDLLRLLRDAEARGVRTFGTSETHWTDAAAALAAEAAVEAAGRLVPAEKRRTRLAPKPAFEHLGDSVSVDPRYAPAGSLARRWLAAGGGVDLVTPLVVVDPAGAEVFASDPIVPSASIGVFGTSFSGLGRVAFPWFVAHAADDLVRHDVVPAFGPIYPALVAWRRYAREGFPPTVIWEVPTGAVLGEPLPEEHLARFAAEAGP